MKNRVNWLGVFIVLCVQISAFANFLINNGTSVAIDSISIDGDIVVWADTRADDGDIYGYDFTTGKEFPIAVKYRKQAMPAISGNIVVWQDHCDEGYRISGYDLATKTVFAVSTHFPSATHIGNTSVNGNWVVWHEDKQFNGLWDLHGYDISTREEFVIDPNVCSGFPPNKPVVRNDIVIWTSEWTSEQGGVREVIYGYNLVTKSKFPIDTDYTRYKREVAFDGETVVWYNQDEEQAIYYYNLQDMQKVHIDDAPGGARHIQVDGNYIVWHGRGQEGFDGFGYDIENDIKFTICPSEPDNIAIQDNFVIWKDGRIFINAIYGFDISTREEFPISVQGCCSFSPVLSSSLYVCWIDGCTGLWATSLLANDDTIFSAEVLLGQVVSGSTAGATGADMTTLGYNDFKDNWHYFVPDSNDKYTISVCGSDFDTTLAVFDEDLVEVEFNDNFCGDQSKLVLRAKVGKKYYVRIAGYDGESGNYTLSIIKDSPEPLRSDVNFDGKVDMGDFAVMAFEWLDDNQN
jgi:beta propeller repeat protein